MAHKVVILDDDKPFGERLCRSFTARGYDSSYVSSLTELKSITQATPPTHAIVDLCLNKESGLDAVTFLIETYATRTILLTGYSSVSTALEAIRRGAINYLSKPVTLDELIQALFGSALLNVGKLNIETPSLTQVEWEHIQRVLRDCDGNITHAAKRLGIHRQALQRKLKSPPMYNV